MDYDTYEKLQTVRTKINKELFDTKYADEDLVKMSLGLNKIIEEYEDSNLSQSDRNLKEILSFLININKSLDRLVKHE